VNPRKRAFWRKISYAAAIAVLLAPIAWLGRPAVEATEKSPGSPGGKLARLRQEYELSQTQIGKIDPTSETIKLACLGLRGVAANILWEEANRYKMKKDWTHVWRFQAWNLSYNVSVEFEDFRQRYEWVIRGINFLRRGVQYNQREPRLLWDIGWYTSNKIGRADEYRQFRRLFKEDDALHESLPFQVPGYDPRDNWLVGKQWFIRATDLMDSLGSAKGMNPLVVYSDAPKCQMSYAAALEEEGTFGERAQLAWRTAANEWKDYGSREIPTSLQGNIRLVEQEIVAQDVQKLSDKIDALRPGLRQELRQKKRADLTDQQRQALDKPAAQRSRLERALVAEAEDLLKVTYAEVAREITGPARKEALKLANEAAKYDRRANLIGRYRYIVNYDYWRLKAAMEQDDRTLAARKLIYEGDQAFANGDMTTARRKYNDGFNNWRKTLDKFPEMLPNPIFGSDMLDVIKKYHHVLDQLDEEFPKNFVLQDVLDEHAGP
jgi:hypothetical protein